MGQIEDLRMFVAVVDHGGIGRAAEALGIAKSAVSRRLGQLEDRYGKRLVNRQPRNWEVTTAGLELYHRARAVVTEADDLDEDFRYKAHSLSGPLSITVAREFGLSFLKPTLFAFMQAHPQIDLTIDFDDRTVDLENENYDLGVRITSQKSSGIEAQHLGASRHGLFASAAYVKQHGLPETLNTLKEHPLLYYGSSRRGHWDFVCEGKNQRFEFRPALNSNNGPFLLDCVKQGQGIARLPDFLVVDAVQSGDLVELLPQYEFALSHILVVYRANKRLNKRMRVLIETLQQSCATLKSV